MIYKNFFSIVLVAALGFAAAVECTHAQPLPNVPELHLDAPVTDENSVRVDFGGAVLRVPKFLIDPKKIPADPKKSIEMDSIGFSFWFPDMTLTCYGSLCGPKDPAQKIDPNLQTDQRFKVYVSQLEYSPADRRMQTSRPSEIKLRQARQIGPPSITASDFKGLDVVSYAEASKKRHPDWQNFNPVASATNHLYFNKPETTYELMMNCDSFWCNGRMYDKRNHFLAQFIIDRPVKEVITKTDDLVKNFYKSIDSWTLD